MNHLRYRSCALFLALVFAGELLAQTPIGTGFTYQGFLKKGGAPLNRTADMQFALYDAESSGTQIGTLIEFSAVPVFDGHFSLILDFGADAFATHEARWIETAVRSPAGSGDFTTLSPRQRLTPAPYSIATRGVTVDAAGQVGLGTTSPRASLHVRDNAAGSKTLLELEHYGAYSPGEQARLLFSQATLTHAGIADTYEGSGNHALSLMSAGNNTTTEWLRITGSGNVGIGTTTPQSALEVVGTIHAASGGFKFPDGSVQTTAVAPSSTSLPSPQRIAQLRWYDVNRAGGKVSIGGQPLFSTFDGQHLWASNGQSVTKIRASDSAILATFSSGLNGPHFMAFDGTYVWVNNSGGSSVTRFLASDGSNLSSYEVGDRPCGVAFDGESIWVAAYAANTVTKLRPSDGAVLGSFAVGPGPYAVIADGQNIWVSNYDGGTLTKLRASDGAALGTFTVGQVPIGLTFDGTCIWVSNVWDNTVMRLRASDGQLLDTIAVGQYPHFITFDGSSIWVPCYGANSVTRIRASDATIIGSYPADSPVNVAFDGVNIWVTNYAAATLTKF